MAVRRSTLQIALAVSIARARAPAAACASSIPEGFNRVFQDTPLEVILVNSRSGRGARAAPRRSPRRTSPAAARPQAGRATSPLPPSALTELGDANEETPQADRAAAGDAAAAAGRRRGASCALLPPTDPLRERRHARGARAGRAAAPADRSCWPRSRSASTRKTRAAEEALHQPGDARGGLRALLRPAAAQDRGPRHAQLPENQGKKLYGELTMNVTVDAEGRVVETEVVRGSGSKVLDRRARRHRHRRRARTAASTRRCARTPISSSSPSRFRFTREENLETTLSSQ